MLNWVPSNPETACGQVYSTVDTQISLGIDFESGTAVSVWVNGEEEAKFAP